MKQDAEVELLLEKSLEIIKDRLYFASFGGEPPESDQIHCFTIDDKLPYEGFCLDFGPLNLGHTYRFCNLLDSLLKDKELEKKKIIYYCDHNPQFLSNAAVLICAHGVLCRGLTPDEAYEPLCHLSQTFEPFHDASYFPCHYRLTVKNCLDGLYRAKELKWFSWPDFNVKEYDHFCDLDNGDLNWLVEDKFLAFAGPFEERKHYGQGYYSSVPGDFIRYFKQKNVTAVIRLNKPCYDASHFTKNGINHYHLFYPDGGNPPTHILNRFIEICEKEKGAIAVHCKAGLGRTGTCIAMYLMKHYKVTAREIIGYFRIARPGSVIGPQQKFLEDHQAKMFQAGKIFRKQQKAIKQCKSSKSDVNDDHRDDKDRSCASVHFVNSNDLYVNLKASSRGSLGNNSDKNLDDLEAGNVETGDELETQGDVLNKLKALHRHHHQP